MLQVYYVITDVATMVQEVADHQDMLRSLSESKLPGQKLALITEIRRPGESREQYNVQKCICVFLQNANAHLPIALPY